MPSLSLSIGQCLLEAGAELLRETGCRGLSARKFGQHAGENVFQELLQTGRLE